MQGFSGKSQHVGAANRAHTQKLTTPNGMVGLRKIEHQDLFKQAHTLVVHRWHQQHAACEIVINDTSIRVFRSQSLIAKITKGNKQQRGTNLFPYNFSSHEVL